MIQHPPIGGVEKWVVADSVLLRRDLGPLPVKLLAAEGVLAACGEAEERHASFRPPWLPFGHGVGIEKGADEVKMDCGPDPQ